MAHLSPKAIELRRQYKRAWYAANKERCREYARRVWEKKAKAAEAEQEGAADMPDELTAGNRELAPVSEGGDAFGD